MKKDIWEEMRKAEEELRGKEKFENYFYNKFSIYDWWGRVRLKIKQEKWKKVGFKVKQ